GSPRAIVARDGLAQVSDVDTIDAVVGEVIAAQTKSVADFRAGKEKALKFLVGQVMKASRGKANPILVEQRLWALLTAPSPSGGASAPRR
ncbi:MAG: hypothetical protein ACREM6_05845, partial [Vulcanimicrobiaceae bacterium]